MARPKKKAVKKNALTSVPSDALPQVANIPEGMKQMGGGYAPTWTPEDIGDTIHGIVSALPKDLTLNKGKRNENTTRVMEVTTMEGDRFAVWDSAVLSDLFDEVNVQGEGIEIFIQYDGLGKKKPGQNPPKLFTVAIAE